jgi:hypothetical protein
VKPGSAETRIADFVAKYTPEMAASIVACRSKLRALFPRGFELIYDNYNALVFGFAPSEKTSESFLSIAAYPRWITLFFLNGATLPDPHKLLQGSGTQVRGVRLASPADLDSPKIRQLIALARTPVASALSQAPPLITVIKLVSAKQRPRRPPATAPKTSRPKKTVRASSAK